MVSIQVTALEICSQRMVEKGENAKQDRFKPNQIVDAD